MRNDRYSLVMGRLLVALAVGLLFAAFVPLTCRGQTLGADRLAATVQQGNPPTAAALHDLPRMRLGGCGHDSHPFPAYASVNAPALCHAPNIARSAPKYNLVLPLGALALGYLGGTIDRDPGNYRDSFKFLPDKQAHFLASVVLSKAVADGTSVKLGFATCLVAGLAWEWGQSRHHGHASYQDASYDGLGCSLGAAWGRK